MIEFVDEPPGPPPRRSKWREIAAALDARPGEWAKVFTAPSPEGARTRKYQLRRQFPEHEWDHRGADVYGRAR